MRKSRFHQKAAISFVSAIVNPDAARAVLFHIAVTSPSAVIRAVGEMHGHMFDSIRQDMNSALVKAETSGTKRTCTHAFPQSIEEQVVAFMRNNHKINSIKFHRGLTGEGLKESKEYVEALMSKYNITCRVEERR